MSEQKVPIAAGERIGLEGRYLVVIGKGGRVAKNSFGSIAVRNEATGRLSYITEARLLKGYRHNPPEAPVVSPGDLRARIEQLPRWAPMASDDGMLRAEAWMERTGIGNYVKLSDVLALLEAAQEQP